MSSSTHGDVSGGPEGSVGYTGQDEGAHDASLSDLLGDLSNDVTRLFRQELELAKIEMKREAVEAGKAAGMLAAGAVAAFVTLLLLAWSASWALALAMPDWVAFLIVSLVFGAVTAGLIVTGRKKFRALDPAPQETIDTLQEDKQMLTDRNHA